MGIVGQDGQKWLKLSKIVAFMLHHVTLWVEYYEIASIILYWVRGEVLLEFDLHVFGIVGQKGQKFVKFVKLDKTFIFILNDTRFCLEYDEIVPTWFLSLKKDI